MADRTEARPDAAKGRLESTLVARIAEAFAEGYHPGAPVRRHGDGDCLLTAQGAAARGGPRNDLEADVRLSGDFAEEA